MPLKCVLSVQLRTPSCQEDNRHPLSRWPDIFIRPTAWWAFFSTILRLIYYLLLCISNTSPILSFDNFLLIRPAGCQKGIPLFAIYKLL